MKKDIILQGDSGKRPLIGVIGASKCEGKINRLAFEVGRLIGRAGFGLVNGGLGGVMEASAEGCRAGGGLTVGILPGLDAGSANPYIDVVIPTGLGDMRNALIVRAAEALIAIGGSFGTLSEIALGLKASKAVIGLLTWEVSEEVLVAATPEEAIRMAIRGAESKSRGR